MIEDMRAREKALHGRMDVLLGERFRAEMQAIQVSAVLPPALLHPRWLWHMGLDLLV